jgi:hypothetical protein
MLLDSGSEVDLISVKLLHTIGLSEAQIVKTQQYNIKSSTEIKLDCILGKIDLNLNLLLKNENNNTSQFGKCKETFLVSGPAVELYKVILGSPFLSKNSIKMFFNPNSCRVTGKFLTEMGFCRVNLFTKF